MKRIFFVLTVLIFTYSHLKAKKVDGKILYEDDTVNVTFNIPVKLLLQEPNYERIQYKIKFYDSSGKKVVLKPDQAKEIRFMYGSQEIRMLSRPNSLQSGIIFSINSNIFLKLEIDGELKMFSYYYTQNSPGMYNTSTGMASPGYAYSVERYILQKENEELKRLKGLSFRKDMMEYFIDCPALSRKIEDRVLKKSDLEAIVRFYNSNCGR